MNLSVYLFGELGNGYTQYPSDYTSTIFNDFYKNAKSNTQIAIHREGNLMYYGYIRKLEQRHYIGLCVVLNDLCIPVIDKLFPLYETIISDLVTNGLLIHFNENGDIVSNVSKLHLDLDEVNTVSEYLRMRFNSLESYAKPLPSLNYGVSKDSVRDFTLDNKLSDIVDSSFTNGYTFVYKNKDYNTRLLNSYKGVLTRLNNDRDALRKKYDELLRQHHKLTQEQKQVKKVIALLFVVIVCFIGLYNLYTNLNNSQNKLTQAEQSIVNKEDSIEKQKDLIDSQGDYISKLRDNYNMAVAQRDKFQNDLDECKTLQPFLFIGGQFNFMEGDYTLSYYGLTETSVTIKIIIYTQGEWNSSSYESTLDISKGFNEEEIDLGDRFDGSSNYLFMIKYEDSIIGCSRH